MNSHPGTAVRHYIKVGAILRHRLPLPLASCPLLSGLPRPGQVFSGDISRPLGGCLLKSRAAHCLRDVIDPGFLLSCAAEVALGTPCAGFRGVSLLTASPTAPAVV